MEETKRHSPLRTCVACYSKKPKRGLMRLVVLESNEITWDRFQKMPGRGAYVCQDSNCIRKLGRTGNLQRRFRSRKILCSQELLTSMIDYVSEDLRKSKIQKKR